MGSGGLVADVAGSSGGDVGAVGEPTPASDVGHVDAEGEPTWQGGGGAGDNSRSAPSS